MPTEPLSPAERAALRDRIQAAYVMREHVVRLTPPELERLLDALDAAETALRTVVLVLGPTFPVYCPDNHCEGCREDMSVALVAAQAALGPAQDGAAR